jgi:hypothetical protein
MDRALPEREREREREAHVNQDGASKGRPKMREGNMRV